MYGFATDHERYIFRNLISVSGVGPATAQVILSTYNTEEIVKFISISDVTSIQNVKGIGAKTAQRIIIDLKDKISKGSTNPDILFNLDNTLNDEALSALVALGFAKKSAEEKINQALKKDSTISTVEDLVKAALS